MKHKGNIVEYGKERSFDLMRAYNKCIASCKVARIAEICNKIVDMPSKRFWVSDARASVVVTSLLKGEPVLDSMWPTKREMYHEIYTRVIRLREQHPELSILELCSIVVMQPAPKFYLTPNTVKIMLYKVRKEWLDYICPE